ncbi:hypothetical protein L4C34_11200 [Vibrio profundum]|uniref:hypothetical protein n=1 Tax=Vibrio profundum TaxID=2910247 RepID=UPI003D0EE192
MFIAISLLTSFSILLVMMFLAKQRENTFLRQYQLIVTLRQLLLLIRQSRSNTHYGISAEKNLASQLTNLNSRLTDKSHQLVTISPFESKPNYRVFQQMLKSLTLDWRTRSVAKNQMVHGKAIRHCLFLIDEVMIAWLVESGRQDLSTEYHHHWQQIVDAMEVLTKLRISIQDISTKEGFQQAQYCCDKMRRTINQLSIISPLTLTSPACNKALQTLSELINNPDFPHTTQALYDLTNDISLNIARVYDQILSDLIEQLYLPLPMERIA